MSSLIFPLLWRLIVGLLSLKWLIPVTFACTIVDVSNLKQIPKFSQSFYYFQTRPNSNSKFGSKDGQRFVDLRGHNEPVLVQVDRVESLHGDVPRQNLSRCDESVLGVQCDYNVMVHKLCINLFSGETPRAAILARSKGA